MKSDKWIIEIEGKKYAVDRCFSGEPAIYHAGGEFQSRGHVDDPFEKSVTGYWGGGDDTECVFILARKVKP